MRSARLTVTMSLVVEPSNIEGRGVVKESSVDLPVLVALGDDLALDPALVGHKAANLARLAAAGLPVPPGVVVTVEACRRVLEAGELGPDPTAEEVAACPIPADLRAQLEQALAPFGEARLAVRSSGLAEDLAGASYAGLYETVLGVVGVDAVGDALRRCLASAFSGRVTAYRASTSDPGAAPMAVLVQRLVDADVAGVAFTADPVSGDRDQVHVSAVRGLGERLVSGEASADECIVRGDSVECRIGPEKALDADLARRVAEMAGRVEALFGVPQDIEWAVAGGELHLLQARPMTALTVAPRLEIPDQDRWEKDTEHYPTPMTAFGGSVYLPCLEEALAAYSAEFGLLWMASEQRSIGGEVYMHSVPVGYAEGRPPPWWLYALMARLLPELRRRNRTAERAHRSGLIERTLERWETEWREELRRGARELRQVDLAALTDEALLAHLDRAIAFLRHALVIHFRLNRPYYQSFYELAKACMELLGWGSGEALTLLTGTSEASSEPARRLGQVAAMAASSAGARDAVEEGGPELTQRLQAVAPEVADAFAAFVDEYGHRPFGYDPGDPTLAERPTLLASLLRDRVHELESADRSGVAGRAREQTIADARAILADRPPADRERFEHALAFAQRAYPTREDNIFWTDNIPSGILRYAALEIGRRLTTRGRLVRPDDAVHLEADELRAALRGETGDQRPLVDRRKAERSWVVAHPGPPAYGPPPAPPPSIRGLPAGLRRMAELSFWSPEPALPEAPPPGERELAGVPGSIGRYTGPVRVIRNESEFDRLRPGDVLVCPTTSPAWSILFASAGALVSDGGSAFAHAAVIAREFGIPAVLGTGDATRRLRDGQFVTVDGTTGLVRLESAAAAAPARPRVHP